MIVPLQGRASQHSERAFLPNALASLRSLEPGYFHAFFDHSTRAGRWVGFSSTETCSVSSRNRPSGNENGPRLKVQGPIQVTFLALQLRTSDLPAVTHRLIRQGGVAAFNTNENAALERRQEIHLTKWMGAGITRGMGAFPLINDE
jgi:hypothetical protein